MSARTRTWLYAAAAVGSVVGTMTVAVIAQTPASGPVDARIWIGRAPEIEEYPRTVPIVKLEDLSVGVTKPKKATLPTGGPVQYLAWKMIPPGRYSGAWESYKSEVAAYELDKFLVLNMVPPTVDKVYRGEHGAAVMWASPTKSFKEFGGSGAPTPPPLKQAAWARQLVKAKMFDNLIGNTDPNLGNWLVDTEWNVILIDHSRSFTTDRAMTHEMTRIDPDLWAKLLALSEESLKPVLGPWMEAGQLRSVLQRRDKMRELVDQMVKKKGEAYVFMKDGSDPAESMAPSAAPTVATSSARR